MLKFFFRSLLRGLSRKIGLRRAVSGHVFSYNVLRRKIYPTLPEPRTYVHYRFSTGKVPNRRDHGSLSRNRPRIVRQHFISFEKKHFYTWCAGLLVHALLTVYVSNKQSWAQKDDLAGGGGGDEYVYTYF